MHGKILTLALGTAIGGCATRHVPAQLPSSAPAAAEAEAAPLPVVGRFTREHPPLPGEPTDGWHGLEAPNEDHDAH